MPKLNIIDPLKCFGILFTSTVIGLWFYELELREASIISIYTLGVLLISMTTSSKIYGMLSSFLGVLAFNFFFTVPRFTFHAYEASYPVTFLIMLIVSILTSTLTVRIKHEAKERYYLKEKQKEAEIKVEREKLRSDLLRAISHDLRTPLTSISGNASILMENSKDIDEASKYRLYEDIYDDALWLIKLVENLLSVTRIDNGKMDINMRAEFVEDVISEALMHINRKKAEHNITVDIEDAMLMCKMDPRLIIQVIINIVDNAIKYTDKGSEIRINVRKANKEVVVEISDNGRGIPNKDKEKLFDMFFTSSDNKGDSRRGLGLGLSLCKSIIDAHGSNLYVKDNTPCGTIFGFSLPLEEVVINEDNNISS